MREQYGPARRYDQPPASGAGWAPATDQERLIMRDPTPEGRLMQAQMRMLAAHDAGDNESRAMHARECIAWMNRKLLIYVIEGLKLRDANGNRVNFHKHSFSSLRSIVLNPATERGPVSFHEVARHMVRAMQGKERKNGDLGLVRIKHGKVIEKKLMKDGSRPMDYDMQKTDSGWKAETKIDMGHVKPGERRELIVSTRRDSNGALVTRARCDVIEEAGPGGCGWRRHAVFGDFSSLLDRQQARCTEKAVRMQHERHVSDERLAEIEQLAKAHYAAKVTA